MWPEIEKALKEKRREVKLLADNVNKDGGKVDDSLYLLEDLNLLQISETELRVIEPELAKLTNLQNLLLFRNKIQDYPGVINSLSKLKVLDLSYNNLSSVPEDINSMTQLTTLNLSYNSIESFPKIVKLGKLGVLNLAGNKLKAIPEFSTDESFLISDLILNDNAIAAISDNINYVANTLRIINLEKNAIKAIPMFLASIPKLKDLHLKENPVADKRLLKLINQCGTKQILDYVKQHGVASSSANHQAGQEGKGKKSKNKSANDVEPEGIAAEPEKKPAIIIEKFDDEKSLLIVSTEAVRSVRPHIICCVWKGVSFTPPTFRAFIQLQTKLHDSVCQKRELCTIATHDFDKIVIKEDRKITYTAGPPPAISIVPLGRRNAVTAQKYYDELKNEAENLRKEKKRNTYSGIHKFLHLLDKTETFAYFKDSADTTISLPPLTNSDNTSITVDTKNILIEITSSSSLPGCKLALDQLVSEMVAKQLGVNPEVPVITLEQVRVVDEEGNLRNVYPSKVDLQLTGIEIQRE